MTSLRLIAFGPATTHALRDAIVEAKGGDPLAPVTVAVPSNYAGLSLRRSLGFGDLSLAAVSGREGLLNVRLLVLARVAELLGAPVLAARGQRPLTGPVRGEAVRAALADEPGIFREVVDHPATERSLDSTFRDLRQAPEAVLDAIATYSQRASHVVRLFRDFRRRTQAYYDGEDLALAAAEATRAGSPALRDAGRVILHLPRRLSPAERTLAEALAGSGALTALIGLTGDREADTLGRRLAKQLEVAVGPGEGDPSPAVPGGTQIVAVTDAEEEVRSVLRMVMARLAAGTPLYRMAVLYRAAGPYALLAHEQFGAAGVPHNVPSVRTLGQMLTGRTVLGLLRLRERDFRRDVVMDWLSAAPVLEQRGGSPVPAHRWDALSRAAGVVGGTAQWRERLDRHRRSVEERRQAIMNMEEGGEWELRRLDADLDHLGRLAGFIGDLTSRVDPGVRRSWPEFCAWARDLLERYLGGEGHRRDWPDGEIEAHRTVEGILDTLSGLSDLRAETDEATFRRALERELEAPAGRIGRFGDGVFVGRIADAMGTDFDVVFILGMTEGMMPTRGRDDPLLPDRERSAASDELPLRASRRAEERRDYLAALAVAPERVLLFPRADLRGQRGKLPAHWLLETVSQLEGRALFSTDLETLPPREWFTIVPSFEAALSAGREPASEQEYDLGSFLRWGRTGAPVTGHYLAAEMPTLRAGLGADLDRLRAALSRWDGRIEAPPGLAPSADRPVSPTSLQHWAACPFRYFVGHVLYVAETEKPEETLTISVLERGNLLHRALEQFLRAVPPRNSASQPWSQEECARLMEIGERLCDEAERAGLTGKPLLWRMERERIMRDLAAFLDADERMRADEGVVPVAVELAFGVPDASHPAIVVSVGDEREVAFRGRIDRVDRALDGSRMLVLDYKSGSASRFSKIDQDPVQGGQLLQLPVYSLAAKAVYGDVPVTAYYWFITEAANFKRLGHPVMEEQLAPFRSALTVIVRGIARGLFPARPGAPVLNGFENCRFCPYDRICPRDRARSWRRKRGTAELRSYVELVEPER